MKAAKFKIVLFSLIILFGCKSNNDKIIGNWVSEDCVQNNGPKITIKANTTYLSNKTFSMSAQFDNGINIVVSGTWEIKNDKIEAIVTTSNNTEIFPNGYSFSDKIIEISDEKLIYIDKDDEYTEEYRNYQILEQNRNKITIDSKKYTKYFIEQVCNIGNCVNERWKLVGKFEIGDFNNDGKQDYVAPVFKEDEKNNRKLAIVHGDSNEVFILDVYAEDVWIIGKEKVKKWVEEPCGDGFVCNSEGIAHPFAYYFNSNTNRYEGCPGDCYAGE